MKKLSKIKLQNAVVLEEQEMKMIYGGSDGSGGSGIGGGRFSCYCYSTGVPWEGLYVTIEAMLASIEMNCGSSGGKCTAI